MGNSWITEQKPSWNNSKMLWFSSSLQDTHQFTCYFNPCLSVNPPAEIKTWSASSLKNRNSITNCSLYISLEIIHSSDVNVAVVYKVVSLKTANSLKQHSANLWTGTESLWKAYHSVRLKTLLTLRRRKVFVIMFTMCTLRRRLRDLVNCLSAVRIFRRLGEGCLS